MSSNDHQSCPLCHSPYPDDLVRKIKSAKMGKPMTSNEFMRRLNNREPSRT